MPCHGERIKSFFLGKQSSMKWKQVARPLALRDRTFRKGVRRERDWLRKRRKAFKKRGTAPDPCKEKTSVAKRKRKKTEKGPGPLQEADPQRPP